MFAKKPDLERPQNGLKTAELYVFEKFEKILKVFWHIQRL